jgi:hypothetical protein
MQRAKLYTRGAQTCTTKLPLNARSCPDQAGARAAALSCLRARDIKKAEGSNPLGFEFYASRPRTSTKQEFTGLAPVLDYFFFVAFFTAFLTTFFATFFAAFLTGMLSPPSAFRISNKFYFFYNTDRKPGGRFFL